MKNWFEVKAVSKESAKLSIYDEIGLWGVTAKEFIAELSRIESKVITLSINSPGGSVFDALAMYNALRNHGARIEVRIMGIAASAASLVAMAGDKIIMPENAFLMVHDPIVGLYGDADDHREIADTLDLIGASVAKSYVAKTGLSIEEVKKLLAADTWLDAAAALEMGFADEIEPLEIGFDDEIEQQFSASASFRLERLPEKVRASFSMKTAEQPRPLADLIVSAFAAAGMAEYGADYVLSDAIKCESDISGAVDSAREVLAICNAVGLQSEAKGLIKSRADVSQARAHLVQVLADADERTNVDNTLPGSSSAPPFTAQQAALKVADVYAARIKALKQGVKK